MVPSTISHDLSKPKTKLHEMPLKTFQSIKWTFYLTLFYTFFSQKTRINFHAQPQHLNDEILDQIQEKLHHLLKSVSKSMQALINFH